MATMAAVHPLDEAPGVMATIERIDAWLSVAKPRDRFVYASRCSLPMGSRSAAHMRALQDRGLVHLHCPRDPKNPTIFNYLAIRTDKPLPKVKGQRPTLSPQLATPDSAAVDALLPVLKRAAHFGRPCPVDKILAQRAGMSVDEVTAAMASLRAAGLIQVTAPASQSKRRVTIVETGQRTGVAA